MSDRNRYTSIFKHNVLEEYRPGVYGCGFKSLAKRFKIKGGHKLIMDWYRQWDGTVESLDRRYKGGRPRTLTTNEVKHYVLDFVNMMNSQHKPVNYRMVQSNVEAALNKMVPLSTIQRYGKEECGLKWRKIREITSRDGKC
jgi:transposase